tara:strand:+ start:8052 stop:8327 length:276 start_codon:yes stop_codon:yes gene_type:complete
MAHTRKFGSPRTVCPAVVVDFLLAIVQLSSVHHCNRFFHPPEVANFAHGGKRGEMVHTLKFGHSSTTNSPVVVDFLPVVLQLSRPRQAFFF